MPDKPRDEANGPGLVSDGIGPVEASSSNATGNRNIFKGSGSGNGPLTGSLLISGNFRIEPELP